jgi:glycosyltransferase involved in cell wall biosynthesis
VRVLHVVATGQRRGAEIFTADLVGALDDAGVSQQVAVLRAPDGLAVPFRAPATVLGADAAGLPGVRMGLPGVAGLRRLLRDFDPDVVQAHGGEALKYAVAGAAGGRRRVVYRRIGSTPATIASGPRRVVYGGLMRRAARIVAVAEAVRQETLEVFRLPPRHVVTIPNAVDAGRLAPTRDRASMRRLLGIPADAEVILSLGALTWEKDPLGHVEVAARALAERPLAWHLLAGDGPLRGQVEAAVARHGTGDRVLLAGVRSDVADVLVASDVVLFASCSEGMPATVIEAGMAGLPVAGYAVAGVAEVVRSGVTGLLAQPGDLDSLSGHVLALLADADRRRRFSEAARDHCRDQFEIRAVAPRYLELYNDLVAA